MIALTYPPCPTRRIDTPPTFSVLERVKVYMDADAGIAVAEATVQQRTNGLPVRDQLGCYWVVFPDGTEYGRVFLAHECELVSSVGWEAE